MRANSAPQEIARLSSRGPSPSRRCPSASGRCPSRSRKARLPIAVAQTRVAAAPLIAQRRPLPSAPPSRDPMVDLALLSLGAVMFGGAIGLAWQGVEQFLKKRGAVTREMQGFGHVFLKDFERPLRIEGVTTSPIRARLRCVPGDRRLEILVAPAAGRRYPESRRSPEERRVRRRTHYPAPGPQRIRPPPAARRRAVGGDSVPTSS